MKATRFLVGLGGAFGLSLFLCCGESHIGSPQGGASAAAGNTSVGGNAAGATGGGGAAGSGVGGDGAGGTSGGSSGTIPPEDSPPDCGTACRMFLNVPVDHPWYFTFQYSATGLTETNLTQLVYGDFDSGTNELVATAAGLPSEGILQSAADGTSVVFARHRPGPPRSDEIVVHDRTTSSDRTIIHWEQPKGTNDSGVVDVTAWGGVLFYDTDPGAGLNEVPFGVSGGAATKIGTNDAYSCSTLCASDKAVYCQNGYIIVEIPIDSPNAHYLTSPPPPLSQGLVQLDGRCSPERSSYAWIDYRDAPGDQATGDYLVGGEVYVMDLASGAYDRVTFDSPDAPRPKIEPSVDGTWVAWRETPDVHAEKIMHDYLYSSAYPTYASVLARRDRAKNETCRWAGAPAVGYGVLRGHKLYGYWGDKAKAQIRVVVLDLDDPTIPWTCAAQ